VRANDGGATWSAPVVIEQVCATPPFFQAFLQGSQVAVGPPAAVGLPGVVYVAWESYPNGFGPGRNIRIRASTNGGVSFGLTNMVTPVTRVGDGFRLQGGFRSFLDLGGLAVDNSMGPRRGNVYVTWQDGRNLAQSDPFSSDGTYRFGDILFTQSTSFGFSWSPPIRVNLDPITNPVDQFQPNLSVDNAGTVGVVFYDRRGDGRNFLIDAELGVSINGGLTWSNLRLTPASFAAVHANDLVVNPVYMGDYIASASDRSGISSGFVLSWGDNSLGDANVEVEKFP
jgi:hypothetical protein